MRLGDFTTCYKCRCISLLNSDAPHTYLSHSSTLNVGVVVEGVEGELCLLTRWFREVSCTLSRFPCIALLWLANFSLFMGEPKIASLRYFKIVVFFSSNMRFLSANAKYKCACFVLAKGFPWKCNTTQKKYSQLFSVSMVKQ